MVNPSKDKGTKAETAVVRYLKSVGYPNVERRALSGKYDRGDISGIPGVVISVKDVAARSLLPKFLEELRVMVATDNADFGVLWWKNRGKSSPAQWDVFIPHDYFFEQTVATKVPCFIPPTGPVRLYGEGFVQWLNWLARDGQL
jgi:hypothetical protein